VPTPQHVRKVVDDYFQSWAARDRDAFLACFADNATYMDPVPSLNVGSEAIGAFWDNLTQTYEKLEPEVHAMHICGDQAAVVLTMSARKGDGGSAIDGVDIIEFGADGRIASLKAYWDPAEIRPLS
jgi:steroid delta-isomerase